MLLVDVVEVVLVVFAMGMKVNEAVVSVSKGEIDSVYQKGDSSVSI